jgi:uncharacterized membrane protein YhdT
MSPDVNKHQTNDHWLVRPGTVRVLRIAAAGLLGLFLLAQFFIPVKAKVPLEGSFGFGAWFGFVCCVAIVFFARILGWWLKRSENYYADAGIEPAPQIKDRADPSARNEDRIDG